MSNKLKYDILSIQDRANKAKAENRRIVNGCAGVLYNDDKSLATYSLVNQAIESRFASYLNYPSVIGSPIYKQGVLNWVFGSNLDFVNSKFNIAFSASLGGTGAISMTFNYLTRFYKTCGIISDVFWPNYSNIARVNNLDLFTHKMVDKSNNFNFDNLEKVIKDNIEKYEKILVIVNDPCQNPTGFCFQKDDYIKLYALLNKYKSKVSLLLDIAYLDYAPMGFIFPSTLDQDIQFDMFLTFSASKSFGLYGARLGGLICLIDKSKNCEDYNSIFQEYGRSTYSCPNNMAMGPLSELLNDLDKVSELKKEIKIKNNRLNEIGNMVASALDRLHIFHLPYMGGFYLTFYVDDAISFCKALESKDIYFSPINKKQVRIAVSGLNKEDIKEFEKRMTL